MNRPKSSCEVLRALSLALAMLASIAAGHGERSFCDPEDGAFDLSAFLDRPLGFIPLVVPITEPAVGGGAALVPVFINLPDDGEGRPDIWAAGGMRTSNGSEGLLAGQSAYWLDGRLHTLIGAADASVNLDFHGLGHNAEAELRWQFHPRWSVLGFGGIGSTWSEGPFLSRNDITWTGGLGLRYLLARKYGLHMGLDVAYGEEGPACYIQFGSAWFRP